MCILFFLVQEQNIRLFLIIIILPIVFFLFFNFSIFKLPKLFLGDSGSLLIGFIISFILIYLAKNKLAHPILLAWSVSIFVYEFLSINFIRLKNNKGIFIAGRDHLHHILLNKSKSIFITNITIVLINIFFFTVGYLSFVIINPLSSLILFILFFVIFLTVRSTKY